MKRALMVGAGVLWFVLVFFVSFRLTFPSDAIAERLRYEVQEGSGGAWALELRDVTPWWVGASAEGVRLFSNDVRRPDAEPELAFAAESARVRVGLGSLMRQAPRLSGTVQIGAGEVDFVVGTRMNQKGTALALGELDLGAPGFPLADLAMLAGASMEGTGALDLDVELDAPEGMRTATGEATVRGSDLRITKLDLSSMGVPDLGLEIPVQEVDLALDVRDGKATVTRGVLRSELATVEVQGEISLRDDLERSSMNLTLLVGSLGQQLQPFKSFLGDEWADGKFHYRCTGTLTRSSCRPDRERASPSSRSSRPMSRSVPPTTSVGTPSTSRAAPMDEDERARRREELRERLRQRREELRADRPDSRAPRRADEEEFVDEEYVDEEYADDEEFYEEDLPPEEEFLEEEEF